MSVTHGMHPGSLSENVYPIADAEISKEKRKALYYNRFIQPFQSLSFGAQGILLTINNVANLSDTWLDLTFAAGTLRPLAAFNTIQRLDFQVGGSQVITVQGSDLMTFILDQAENGTKRTEIQALAGGDGGAIVANTTYYMPLALPWSNIRALSVDKLPFPADLLSGPVKIFVYLNAAANVYSSASPPSALVSASLHMRVCDMSNQSDKMVLQNEILNYPYAYLQSFVSSPVTPASTTTNNTIYMNGFRSGNLVGILIRSIDVANIPTDPYKFNTLKEVKILLNGTILFQFDSDNYKIANLYHNSEPCKITVNGVSYYYIHINFSSTAIKNKSFGLNYMHGIDFTNQLVQLDFQSSSTNAQQIACCYVYNGSVLIGNGNSEVVV
jgi:hypothetical protein